MASVRLHCSQRKIQKLPSSCRMKAAIRTSLPAHVWGAISLTKLAQSTLYSTDGLRVAISNNFPDTVKLSCSPSAALTRRCMPSRAEKCTFLGTKIHRPSQLASFLVHGPGPDDMVPTQSIPVPAVRLAVDPDVSPVVVLHWQLWIDWKSSSSHVLLEYSILQCYRMNRLDPSRTGKLICRPPGLDTLTFVHVFLSPLNVGRRHSRSHTAPIFSWRLRGLPSSNDLLAKKVGPHGKI
jgi:hypothetical protein